MVEFVNDKGEKVDYNPLSSKTINSNAKKEVDECKDGKTNKSFEVKNFDSIKKRKIPKEDKKSKTENGIIF